MKFGMFFEHQVPRPWEEADEARVFAEALEQIELADRVGIDCAWLVEHHFLEEYSHSSAPKPFQRPHRPVWVACTRRATIQMAAQHGIGALSFAFSDPEEASLWVGEYYETLATEGIPIGDAVNANLACVTGFFCHDDEA